MSIEPLILAVDQGTTSCRALVFNSTASIVEVAQEEFAQIYTKPGWVEHDAEEIWEATLRTMRAAAKAAEARGGEIRAIGITNQRETTVIWDRKTLRPIANAIVWQDRRTADLCARLREEGREESVRSKTGLLLDPYFSATKASLILNEVEGARACAQNGELAFGTIDSFLLARLTGGVHLTDATNASRTLLYNICDDRWDDDLLALFDVPAAILPEVRDNISDFGVANADILGRPVPVMAMVGDQQSAAVGQGCFKSGDIKSTYGTGCFVVAPIDKFALSKNRLLTTIARRIDGEVYYALEGSIFVAGAAVQWLRDSLGIIETAADTEALACSLESNGGVYLAPAFTGLGAPHWAADARGAIVGLTRGAGRAHIARAALESVAYQTADLIVAMRADGAPCHALKVDGGMVANDWLMQFLADMLNTPVDRPEILETTALGAAFLAGVGAGVYESLEEVSRLRRTERVFDPAMEAEDRSRLRQEWGKAIERILL